MQNQIPEKQTPLSIFTSPDTADTAVTEAAETAEASENEPSVNIFLQSLENLRADDIAPKPKKKKRSAYDIIYSCLRYTLLIVCSCVFVWSMYTIMQSLVGYREAEDLYASLADLEGEDFEMSLFAGSNAAVRLKQSPITPDYASSLVLSDSTLAANTDVEINVYNEKFEKMKSKLNSLAVKNSDVYGWIKIDNTVINYPIMQSEDNEYYLDHTYENNYLAAGSIFADFRNYDKLMKNFHVILYGHNMRNGMMFNNVMNYLDEKFFDENPYIEVYTFDGIYTYEVFAIYETRYDYDYIRTAFPNYDEFIAYCEKLRANSLYEREGIEFGVGDRLLTLSTCTNNVTETGRYALHAKLIKTEK